MPTRVYNVCIYIVLEYMHIKRHKIKQRFENLLSVLVML